MNALALRGDLYFLGFIYLFILFLHTCMTIYQTKYHTLLQIKEQKYIDKFEPKLNKT